MSNFYYLSIFLLITNAPLKASYLGDSTINIKINYLITLIVVILIFCYIFFKNIKKKRKKISKKKCNKNVDEHIYLNDIIESALKEYTDFNSCKPSSKKSIDTGVSNKLNEAHIYLGTVTDKINSKVENFDLEKFIKDINYKLYDQDNCKEFNIITTTNISYSIIADKTIISNIFTLLALLQFKEHNLKNATANIELIKNLNILKISVNQGLDYNLNIQKALNNNLKPIYNSDKKRYYGIYLYLINKLAYKINGTLKIDILKDRYTLDITIPVNIEQIENRTNLILPKEFKNGKKALIICEDENLSSSISIFLNTYSIKSEVIKDNNMAQMPNFIDYDILITTSTLLLSIISDYLLSIKSDHNLKIVAIESKTTEYNYQKGLVDFKLKKPILQSKIYKMIFSLYNNEIIKKTDISSKENKLLQNNKNSFSSSNRKKHNRVLIADDDRVNLHLLKKMIEQFNVEVTTAKNGEEALNILEEEKNFDLIILDSIMPKINAHEAIKKIRAKEEYNSIPVIIHSSFSMQEHSIDTIFKLGFDSYLPKPFNMEKLQSILQRYLQIDKLAVKTDKSETKKYYEEFIAIYANSDKLVEKFVSENQKSQLRSLLRDLKNISMKIDNIDLTNAINSVEDKLKTQDGGINSDTVYSLINQIKETKNYILSKL